MTRCSHLAGFVLLAVPAVAMAHCNSPVILFQHPASNIFTLAALLVVPPVLALALFRQGRERPPAARLGLRLSAIAFGVCVVPACATAMCGVSVLKDGGIDYSFERLSTTQVGRGALVVYRTDGGAMTSFGIVVRYERPLIAHVNLVSDVCNGYPADGARISETVRGHYTIGLESASVSGGTTCEFQP